GWRKSPSGTLHVLRGFQEYRSGRVGYLRGCCLSGIVTINSGPLVSQSASEGKQEVRQRMAQRRSPLPNVRGRPLSRALVPPSTTKDSCGAKDLTMFSTTRYAKQRAKARRRRYRKAHER